MNKFKKIVRYILNYNRNKRLLRIIEDESTTPFYMRHLQKSMKYSYFKKESAEQLLSLMVISYHSLEKGLAMSDKRYGFGQLKMRELIKLCNDYLDSFMDYPSRLVDTLGVIAEYNQLHKDYNYTLDADLQESIDNLLNRTKGYWVISHTRHITEQDYFKDADKCFEQFALSRHSIRDFDGTPVSQDVLDKVFALSQNAPSACNRQSTRVYAVYDEGKRKQLVELQNHGRGFADNANPILVIATEMQSWCAGEQWFGGYVDAGIYMMNLLYALHYHKIAAIPLNWYAGEEANKKIHDILNIPDSQEVVAFIACGNPIEEFQLVTSKRRNAQEIVTFC